MIPSRYFSVLLSSIFILFLALYLMLSFHSRIAGDDFFYLGLRNEFGVWKGMLDHYHHWSGRWSTNIIGCWMLKWWNNPFFLPFVNLITLIFLFIAIKSALGILFRKLEIDLKKSVIAGLAFVLFTSFFFSSYSIGETWFWYIIILTYLWSIIAFIFVLNCLFSDKNNFSNYIFLSGLSIFIGGAAESFALIFILILTALLGHRIFILKKSYSDKVNIKIIIALLFLIVSFSFNATAQGATVRHSLLPHTSLMTKSWVAMKAYVKFFIRYIPSKFFYLMLFSFPWLLFGNSFLKNKFSREQIRGAIKLTTICFLGLIFIMFLPTAFVMSETGPDRALSIISFSTAIYFAIIFSLVGSTIELRKLPLHINGVTIFLSAYLILTIVNQFSITKKFAEAYDERIKIIQDAKANNFSGVLSLEKIPDHGMLYWDELSADTSYFVNQHLKYGLGLSFPVKLKE